MTARLLHATPEPEPAPRRRLLLISYHFPPDTTVGSRRWEKMAQFVVERGWGLDVITRDLPDPNPQRLQALPPGVRVWGVAHEPLFLERLEDSAWRRYRAIRPARAAEPSGGSDGNTRVEGPTGPGRPHTIDREGIRRSAFTPRGVLRGWWSWRSTVAMRDWAHDAARAARAIASAEHLAVVTSGPPHESHEAGCLIARHTGLPLVVDMRDPWSLSPRLPEKLASPVWLRLASRHEAAVVRQARLVVANTIVARDAMARLYPERAADIITVMNGVDDDPLPPPAHGPRFTIRYAGTIYTARDPQRLLGGVATVIRELNLTPEQIAVDFLGAFDGPGEIPVTSLAEAAGIARFVTVTPRQPHAVAMQFLAGAHVLVTFAGWSTMTIPAKTFECARFTAWLLALSDLDGANGLLLRDTDADVVQSDDAAGIAAAIRRRYLEFQSGARPRPIAMDDRFSRRTQAGILLDAIERLSPQPDGRRERTTRS